jgi:hypothetical protein
MICDKPLPHGPDCNDASIVLAAYDRFGEGFLPRLIGDFSLALIVERSPRALLTSLDTWHRIQNKPYAELLTGSQAVASGYIDRAPLLDALNQARFGNSPSIIPLLRALALEYWLRGLDRPKAKRPQEQMPCPAPS